MDIQPCQGQTTVIKNLRDGTKLSHVYPYLLMIHDHDVHSQIFRQLLNPWKKKLVIQNIEGAEWVLLNLLK